jgi:carbonic anhydrase/acetyltransferase-like protein (isoleucine patch superfamily)
MSVYSLDGVSPEIAADAWIAPTADVIGNVTVCERASVWFGAVLRGDNENILLGAGSNIQENSVLHTDIGFPLGIGANCTIGHKAILHGCTLGDQTLIGMGATILNGAKIGKNCLIGAGALVTEGKVIPDGSLVVGTNNIVRQLSADDIAGLLASAKGYQLNADRFAKGLQKI